MRISVKVQGKNFEVEIIDLLARPVVAYVEGERFEIWPKEENGIGHGFTGYSQIKEKPGNGNGAHEIGYANKNGNGHTGSKPVHAPIPGTIRSVDVTLGDQVTQGQQLCVLEAMKMYNSIRATRSGIVSAVRVTPGEHVGRNEVLVVLSEGVL